MARHNVLMAVAPFTTPAVHAVSSQQARFPGANVLTSRPWKRWRTTAATAQMIDLVTANTPNALYLGNVNYQEITVHNSIDGVTWRLAGPNMLRQSHRQDQSPWVAGPGVIVLPNWTTGPNPNGPAAVLMQCSGVNGIEQVISLPGDDNRTAVAGFWLRATGAPIQMTLTMFIGSQQSAVSAVIGSSWQLLSLTDTNGGALGQIRVLLTPAQPGQILIGGAFVKNSLGLPMTTYQTGATGLLVPTNPYTGARQMLIDLAGQSRMYTRLSIPAQTPTDGSSSFATGNLLPVHNLQELPDYPQFPLTVDVKQAVHREDLEDESREFSVLGNRHIQLQLQGSFASQHALGSLQRLAKAPLGTLVLVHDNLWVPGSNKTWVDPSQAYLTQLTGRAPYTYDQLPEIVGFSWDLTEVA